MVRKEELPVCPRCHKTMPSADAAFCAYCGAPLHAKADAVLPEVREFLKKVDKQQDPAKKHALLLEGQKQFPDCLPIEEELLFLGRLHERSPKKLDFSIIKCHLWHLYLTPGDFSEEKRQEMRSELLSHPQLKRCMELSGEPEQYLRRYLERLAAEFVTVFLKGSSYYSRSFMGIRLDSRMEKVLAEPLAQMMSRIRSDEEIDEEHRSMMYDALYRAFLSETGGNARWVDEELEEMGCPVPVKL